MTLTTLNALFTVEIYITETDADTDEKLNETITNRGTVSKLWIYSPPLVMMRIIKSQWGSDLGKGFATCQLLTNIFQIYT